MRKKRIKWFTDLFIRPYNYKFVDEIPDRLKSKVIYFIGSEGYYWQAVMICPCGCKKVLQMNLITDYKPFWEYKIERKKWVTLSPVGTD
jgi:hypothetical protein